MSDRTYAQVLVPRVLTDEDEDNEDGRRALVARFEYVNPTQNNGNHPVLPIPYLKRGLCFFVRIKEIVRRIHACGTHISARPREQCLCHVPTYIRSKPLCL